MTFNQFLYFYCYKMYLWKKKKKLHRCFWTISRQVYLQDFNLFTSSGIDMQFLRAGLDLAQEAVYSLHKSTTREVCYFFLFAFLLKKKIWLFWKFLFATFAFFCKNFHENILQSHHIAMKFQIYSLLFKSLF